MNIRLLQKTINCDVLSAESEESERGSSTFIEEGKQKENRVESHVTQPLFMWSYKHNRQWSDPENKI